MEQGAKGGKTRRIAFIAIPHFIAEGEEARRGGGAGALPLVIVSGNFAKSVVIDYSRSLERSPVKRGGFVKSLAPLRGRIRLLPVDHEYVEGLHRGIVGHLRNFSPRVEGLRAGSYCLDLTGTRRLFGRELETCGRIIREIEGTFKLHARAGLGNSVLVARMAARVAGEGGVYDVCPSSEALFLTPLGIELLPELSPRVKRDLLSTYNIRRVGDLAPFTKEELTGMFGREGNVLYTWARNSVGEALRVLARDGLLGGVGAGVFTAGVFAAGVPAAGVPAAGVPAAGERVLERELVVSSPSNEDARLRRQFFSMVLELCVRMREERVLPGAFSLRIVYQDNYRLTCGGRLGNPSSFEKALYDELIVHLNRALARRTCVKKILLSFSRLVPHACQLELFQDNLRTYKLAGAFDELERRFGKGTIGYGG